MRPAWLLWGSVGPESGLRPSGASPVGPDDFIREPMRGPIGHAEREQQVIERLGGPQQLQRAQIAIGNLQHRHESLAPRFECHHRVARQDSSAGPLKTGAPPCVHIDGELAARRFLSDTQRDNQRLATLGDPQLLQDAPHDHGREIQLLIRQRESTIQDADDGVEPGMSFNLRHMSIIGPQRSRARGPLRDTMRIVDDLSNLAVAPATARALREIAVQPRGTVSAIVLSGPGDTAFVAGRALAFALVRPSAQASDVRIASPDGDRWRIDELDERVMRPSLMTADDRTVIVVARADAMDARASDHLLKTIEEPAPGTVFILTVADTGTLPATIRGRVSQWVEVEPDTPRARAELLADRYGLSPAEARSIVDACGHMTALAARLAASGAARSLLDVLSSPVVSTSPVSDAYKIEQGLDALARLGNPLVDPDDDANSVKKSADKAIVRLLCGTLLDNWSHQVAHLLRDTTLNADVFAAIRTLATSIETARTALSRFAPLAPTLAVVLLDASQLHDAASPALR